MLVDPVTLQPIGRVRSPVTGRGDLPGEGVEATIEVFPKFRAGLREIESNTHVIVLGWFHEAGRDRTALGETGAERGVFGLRSAARPNPLGLTICRLLVVAESEIRVANLDFVDGTPVVDIKRYSPAWDCVFSARTSRDRRPSMPDDVGLDEAIRESVAFHGEECAALIAGCRLVLATSGAWESARKAPDLTVQITGDGCLADTFQALTGATFGTRRLIWSAGPVSALRSGDRLLRFVRQDWHRQSPEVARVAPLSELFAFLDPVPWPPV